MSFCACFSQLSLLTFWHWVYAQDVVENYEPERYRLHGMPGTPKTRFEVVSRFFELEHSKMKMGFGNA